MIKILAGYNIELEVDPNPNGLPVLFIHFKYGARILNSIMLDKGATELLAQELSEKLKEM